MINVSLLYLLLRSKFLQLLLSKWDEQLQNRTREEKLSTKGKLQGATYGQTQVYLKPLLRKLKSFTLPEDISDSLTEIVVHLLNRNYLKVSHPLYKHNVDKLAECYRLVTPTCKWR